MNNSDATMATNPAEAAENVGKRLLTLIDQLNASNGISLGQLAEVMGGPSGRWSRGTMAIRHRCRSMRTGFTHWICSKKPHPAHGLRS